MACPRGYRKDGKCKRKPGPKKGSRKKKGKRVGKRKAKTILYDLIGNRLVRVKSFPGQRRLKIVKRKCLHGRKKTGGCKKKPGPKRGYRRLNAAIANVDRQMYPQYYSRAATGARASQYRRELAELQSRVRLGAAA